MDGVKPCHQFPNRAPPAQIPGAELSRSVGKSAQHPGFNLRWQPCRYELLSRDTFARRDDFWSAEFIPLHTCRTRGANLVHSLMRSERLPALRPVILPLIRPRPTYQCRREPGKGGALSGYAPIAPLLGPLPTPSSWREEEEAASLEIRDIRGIRVNLPNAPSGTKRPPIAGRPSNESRLRPNGRYGQFRFLTGCSW